ncbi:nucleoside-triphosphate diphosphatase [Streptococcus massiliensis]|uniref:dITP/XTP pyrophosphatase n=1 Tax=Streptococcus massiliensis TaxID=313439 RepID=A0A380KZJ6_9STRE|nr:nucleoside-triphosphate diphosphatase [Streptococcus massiliensis]SUN76719.1 putative deoxyribonucleotide triphosphate pyrophosphatase/uncharacterised domain fusion protein [Streptococcus massiliensis]
MTNKIYEYKADKDWYLAQFGDGFGPMFQRFEPKDEDRGDSFWNDYISLREALRNQMLLPDLFVARISSFAKLVSFVIGLVNERENREVQLLNRSGALLLVEKDQLLFVHLPEGGVLTNSFFGGELKETLLIATRNEGKTREFRAIFEKLGYKVENLNDYPDLPEVAETGTTFEENARLKAETISQLTGKMVLADDSGLQVDILGGLPGVWSARFAGTDATDDENNAKLLHELAMVFEQKDRAAHFHTTLVVASPDRESLVVEADWPGYIAFQPKGDNGFGYDPLFLVGETGHTSAELSLEEKNKQSHRALAVAKLVEEFPRWQSKQS